MGQGNQKSFDLCAGKVGSQQENPLQNGSTLNQAAGANPAFFVPLLVLQNLLSVFKLPNLLQDFLPFFFWGWAVIFRSCQAPLFFGNTHRLTVHFCRAKYRRSLRSAAWMDFPACDGVIPSIAAISFTFIPSI